MPSTPRPAMVMNQTTQTGPNTAPIRWVPRFCSQNNPMITPMVIGTTQRSSPGAATFSPSTAESTEIAGVITPSP
jgi:hypothetical protein